jgi:hypothetical protein
LGVATTNVRRRSEKAVQSETRVKDALNKISTKTFATGCAAAKATGVSKSTVYRRLSGGKNRAEARESQQILHNHEEKSLIAWITMMAATGNPVNHAYVREMAEEIRSQCVSGINDEFSTFVSYPPIGQDWVNRFLKRYPFMKTALSHSIEAARLKEVSSELVSEFFDVLTEVIKELDIQLENIYNMDKTGIYTVFTYTNSRIFIGNKWTVSHNYKFHKSEKL